MNFSQSGKIKWLTALVMTATLVGCATSQDNNADQNQGGTAQTQMTDNQTTKRSQVPGVERESNTKSTPAERNPNRGQVSEIHTPSYKQRAPQVGPTSRTQKMSPKQMANFISSSVDRIPGVERSVVLVSGNTALVGVDLQSNISGSKIDSIKYSVKEAAESSSTGGLRAVVTADVDTVTRLRELAAGTKQGRPISSFADEVADIIARLIPET